MGRGPASLPANRSPSVLIGPADLLTGPRSRRLHLFARDLDHGVRATEPATTVPCLSCLSSEPTCYPRFPCSDPGPLFSFPSGSPHPLLLVLNYSTFDSLGTLELMKYFDLYHCTASAPGRDWRGIKNASKLPSVLVKNANFPQNEKQRAWQQPPRRFIPSSVLPQAQATQPLGRRELGVGDKDHSGR